MLYCVRDKAGSERAIRIVAKSPDGNQVEVVKIDAGVPSQRTTRLTVDSLAKQAAKGWCHVLVGAAERDASPTATVQSGQDASAGAMLRLDIQNFGRCCADIARANIKFSTQLIKDVGDGPFRAGNFEKAFLMFEQLAVGFNSAVGNSRREIADGRRTLAAEKEKLSGKEIQERSAAFIRSEQLIHTAEREFSTILEGLRMYLRASIDSKTDDDANALR